MTVYCLHCDLEPRVYRNGLCRPCNAYKHKYGHHPPTRVLRARVTRAVEADLTRRARGAA